MLEKVNTEFPEKAEFPNEILRKFNNPVEINSEKSKDITDKIQDSVDGALRDVVESIIVSNPLLSTLKNIDEIAKYIKKILTGFATFEYVRRTGTSIFRVKHNMETIGAEFLKMFFEKIFQICLKDFSFHIIFKKNSLSVLFR